MSTQARSRPAPASGAMGSTPSNRAPVGVDNSQVIAQLQARGQVPTPRPRPLTPAQVFDQRYLAQKDREIDPSERRWKRLSEEQAARLAATPADQRPAAGTPGFSTSVNGATWQWDAHAEDPDRVLRARDLMGGQASQVFSRAFTTANPDHADRTDVTVLNADGTVSVQAGNEHGMVELPESGHGFRTHNRDDVRVGRHQQPDQWGTAASIARTMNIMSDYATLFPGSSVSIGDLSTDEGDSPRLYDNRPQRHATHYDGSQVDLQYVDGAGSTNRASTEDANLFRQRSFLRTAENWGMNNFHAAPSLEGQLFPAEGTTMHYNRGHADHLHMGSGSGTR